MKIHPLKMSTRIHCPREFSMGRESVLICHSFSVVLTCQVNKKSGNVLPVYTKLILIRHTRGNFDRSYQQFKQFLIKVDLQFETLILDGI